MANETKKFMSADNLLYVWQKIKTLLTDKVDKVDGKGLSTNDYTSAEKTKLAGIASGAQVNTLEGIQVNGSTVTPTNKIANINLSAYALKSDIASVYNVKGSITWANLIAKTDAKVGDVYNVTDKGGANYVCIKANTAGESSWDKLGETVDLSGYALKTDIPTEYVKKIEIVEMAEAYPQEVNREGHGLVFTNQSGETNDIAVYRYFNSTTSMDGLMSAEDKTKLDGLSATEELTNAEIDTIFAS